MIGPNYIGQAPNPCGCCFMPDGYRFLGVDGERALLRCDNCGEFSLPVPQCAGIIESTETAEKGGDNSR